MSESRKTSLYIKYNSVNASHHINKYLESFSYEDCSEGESDKISLSFDNINKKWLNEWFPVKGDSIDVVIKNKNWNHSGANASFKCGSFHVDDFSFEGRPLRCDIEGLVIPVDCDFKTTKKTRTWKYITLHQLAYEISRNAGLDIKYDGDDVYIYHIEQSNEEDCSFLNKLSSKYGFAMKIFNNQLIIYNEEKYENEKSVCSIDESDMLSWKGNSTLSGVYTGGKLQYSNPDTGEDLITWVGNSPRIMDVDEQVENIAEAKMIAANAVNNSNKESVTLDIKIQAIPGLCSTKCVDITGLGKFNGKYFIKKIKHNIGSGYTMDIELRLIQERIKIY